MAGKTLDDIIKINDFARRRATQAMATVARNAKIDPGEAVKELDRMIAQQGERIEATRAAMAESVARFEADVKLREGRIDELKKLREKFGKGPERDDPRRERRLQDIRGIGPVAEQRLRENGIDSVQALSELPPARLARILDVSEDKASEFVKEATRLLRR